MIYPGRIFDELDVSRFCCITGSLSSGKDRLAWELALPYWRRGWTCVSNTPHNFIGDDRKPEVRHTLTRTFCVVSEGGEYIRKAGIASDITRSAGKADYYVIFAGKRLPHKELQEIIVRTRFDFFANFGIPAILWKAFVNATDTYSFNFWQILPQGMHGTYSTLTSTGGIEPIINAASRTVEYLARMEGQTAGVRVEAGSDGLADDLAASGFAAIS